MKKIMFCVIAFVCVMTIIASARGVKENEEVRIYVVDSEMMHLIPVSTRTAADTAENKAKYVISKLISGFDSNTKIRRLIPKINNCMQVRVQDGTAYVNISSKMIKNHPDGREAEKLTVYSIVNSLLEIKGINRVRFTINGKTERDFKGFIDMRNSFSKKEAV